jgi:hypothetical protein
MDVRLKVVSSHDEDELDGGKGIGRTRKNPNIIGSAVPSERMSKKWDASPGKNIREIVEKRKAERPKPERTRPTVVARALSGNDLAVALIALDTPALPPVPDKNPHITSSKNVVEGSVDS